MLREMADLGFSHVELSHGIRITLVPGILRAVEEGVVKVSSTHNFCPLPMGLTHAAPNVFEPSRSEPQEQDQWRRHTKRSIDFAAQVRAAVLVTHLGSVRFFWSNPGQKLRRYAEDFKGTALRDDARYQRLLQQSVKKRAGRMAPFWAQVKQSLSSIRDYALEKNVRIGCENREKFEELPADDAFDDLFQSLGTPQHCGYWHDTGHAELKQESGLVNHRELLTRNIGRTLGFHLHDVVDGDDHQPIGSGRIDFVMVSEFWRPEHVLVLELSPRLSPEDVIRSRDAINALVDQRFGSSTPHG